jgi:chemotaxis protein MotB
MKRKSEQEHENNERWLITYADLITLLLAFFIMMYTFSKADAQKYQEVSDHLKMIFTGGTSFMKTGTVSSKHPLEVLPNPASSGEVRERLEKELKAMNVANMEKNISVTVDERGVVINIMDRTFFDEGRAELKDGAKKVLKQIVPILKGSPNSIRIEGHTDNVPISTPIFKSNWELSVSRATEVVRHLIEKYDFPPARVSATGYSEYKPIAPNDTAANRALNRRIEIILLQK